MSTRGQSASTLAPRHSTPNLSSLPPEIREQIWLYTISPRKVHLHYHCREIPISEHELPSSRRLRSGVATKFTAVSFSAAEGPVHARSFLHGDSKLNRFRGEDLHPRTAVAPEPAALFVCRESRAIALRHASYERAFAGRNLMKLTEIQRDKDLELSADKWLGECKEKRIWVDFERDEVVADKIGCLTYANEEIEKIRSLGIYRTDNADGYMIGNDEMVKFLPLFTGLRELSLYLKFEEGDLVVVEDLEKRLMKELALARKERVEEWSAELPALNVLLYDQ